MSSAYICDHNFPSVEPQRSIIEDAGFHLVEARPVCATEEDVIERCREAEVLLVQKAPITRRVMEALPRLRGLVRYGIGVDVIDLDAAQALRIGVANVPTYCLEEVSNHAIAMILSLARRIPQEHYGIVHGKWRTSQQWLPAVSEMTLGLVGFGGIARLVARKAQAIGFEVQATDPNLPDTLFHEMGVRRVSFEDVLTTSDAISMHCPLLPSTRHLIDEKAIERMKDNIILVNTSRGPIIHEADLIAALLRGKVSGAGLDVFEREPLAEESPLRTMANVILTSHSASYSTKSLVTLQIQAAQAAVEFLRGKMPVSQIA
jgi:D-3-phosphoglycerate dehydrogenase